MNNQHWQAEQYAADFDFVPLYGTALFDLIAAPKGSTVLDLGCGNGTLTAKLAALGYQVQGLDASPELTALARRDHPELSFMQGDAVVFELREPVDVIFSNAVFHWIDAELQPALLEHAAAALKPGGELVCEFGGYGNNAMIHQALSAAFARRGLQYKMPFFFPTIGQYGPLVEQAGMQVRLALLFDRMTPLFDRMTPLKGQQGLRDWIYMFVSQPFAGLTDAVKDDIIAETVDALRSVLYIKGQWYADYVRLRLRAVKAEQTAA